MKDCPIHVDITHTELVGRRDITIVDIRTEEERSLCGYIPGSLPFPMDALIAEPWRLLEAVKPREPVALVCMSGRRSSELCSQPLSHLRLYSLAGGVLGWGAAGLPLCGITPVEVEPVESLKELERALMSCFVAESVEALLSRDPDAELHQSPRQKVLDRIEARRAMGSGHYEAIQQAIQDLGRIAWHSNHPLDKIATNVDRMCAMLADLPREHRTDDE